MNRCYRVIFNHATGVYQCVSEFAKAKGKTKSVKALSITIGLVLSGQVLAADIEFTDGQVHHYPDSVFAIGGILITNAGTTLTSDDQIVFGSTDNPANTMDTTVEISNGASTISPSKTIIAHNSNTTVTVNNATLDSKKILY